MGRLRPFPIVGGAYTDDALPWAHQDTVNYLPVRAEREGTRSPAKLAMPPGMRVVADVGTGPHRGGRDVEGQSFVVSGTTLYKVTVDGVATSCGTIPGTGRVRITHNQITGGNQVFIATGSSGYVYDTVAETLVQVTDDGFPGAKSCDFLGQYILGVEPFGRYWFHSALADATSFNALDVFQAETQADRIQGLIALNNQALIFGLRTVEPWVNVPTENAAFQLQVGSVIEVGCGSGDTICRLDNTVFFLTDKGQVCKLEGNTPRVISTYAMEGAIKDCELSRAFAFTWEDKGHTVYYLTFPDGQTWGYDVRQNEWHRRESYGIDRWRLNTLFKSNGIWYGGDYQNGKLYRLDWTYALDGCEPISRRRSTGYIHDNGEQVRVNAFQVVVDSGAEESVSHDGVTITGEMPDGFIGDAVNYQYTITTAFPGQTYTVTATGLPTGLSCDADGLITGTLTAAGDFTPVYTVTADCGTGTASDAVAVSEAQTSVWFAASNELLLHKSADGGLSFPSTVATGITTVTSSTSAFAISGRLFHLGFNEGAVTLNGSAWAPMTGVDGKDFTGAVKTATEWILFPQGFTPPIASTDAVAFSVRGTLYSVKPALQGTTILAKNFPSDGSLNISTDDGATFSNYSDTFASVQWLMSTGTAFIAFGNDGAGNLLIRKSPTGLSGSWTTVTAPVVTTNDAYGAALSPGGRLLLVLTNGDTWFTDDEGVSWAQGATITPFVPTASTTNNVVIFAGDAFLVTVAKGSGVNAVVRSTDGVAAWADSYSVATSNAIKSIVEFTP